MRPSGVRGCIGMVEDMCMAQKRLGMVNLQNIPAETDAARRYIYIYIHTPSVGA